MIRLVESGFEDKISHVTNCYQISLGKKQAETLILRASAIISRERETGIEPATFALARRRSTTEPLAHKRYRNYHISKCLRQESNQRHMDFQSIALPTELPRQDIMMMSVAGIEPATT